MDHDFSLLLVEPETTQQSQVEEVLQTQFEINDIMVSNSSMDALSVLGAENNIQCIIVSSNLQDSNGFSLISDIRAINKYSKTPVLIMSDVHERDHLLKAAASGASDFIVKPFNSRSLALKLKKLLADKQFRKATRISTLEAFDVTIEFNEGTSYDCKLLDISEGGCSIKSQPFKKGGAVFDQVTININNNGTPLIITAELARTERDPESEDNEHKFQIAGFEFINLNQESQDMVSQFINNVGI